MNTPNLNYLPPHGAFSYYGAPHNPPQYYASPYYVNPYWQPDNPIYIPMATCHYEKVDYQLIEVDYGYATEKIDISDWTRYRANILWLPTGAGKTTFVKDVIVAKAISSGKTVLIVSNRIATDIAIKRWIADMLNLYPDVSDEELRDIDTFGCVTILTYQKLPKYMKDHNAPPDYAVFDEAHYFTSDATFSSGNGSLLRKIPEFFLYSIRVYMSATMKDVLRHICEAEHTLRAEVRIGIENVNGVLWLNCGRDYYLYDSICTYKYRPIVYKMQPMYSHIDLKFITRDADVNEIVLKSDGKSIVFVDDGSYGKELKAEIKDAIYLDRSTKDKNPEIFNYIIRNEKFNAKVLISTSVFCNGCNIKDLDVKNVIILCTDPTEIIQMVGRVRKISSDQRLSVFIKVSEAEKIERRINDIDKTLGLIRLSEKNYLKFMRNIMDSCHSYELVRNITYPNHNEKYAFDQLTKTTLNNNLNFCERLLNVLQTEGVDGYCKIYAELFDKEYSPDMLQTPAIDCLCSWLENIADKQLSRDEFTDFCNEFKKAVCRVFKGIKKDNRPWKKDACNNRFKTLELPYCIHESGIGYVLRKEAQPQ